MLVLCKKNCIFTHDQHNFSGDLLFCFWHRISQKPRYVAVTCTCIRVLFSIIHSPYASGAVFRGEGSPNQRSGPPLFPKWHALVLQFDFISVFFVAVGLNSSVSQPYLCTIHCIYNYDCRMFYSDNLYL